MRKYIVAVLVVTGVIIGLMVNKSRSKSAESLSGLKAGSSCRDFVLGMKNKTLYNLKDFFGRYLIVLAFTDNGMPSAKLNRLLKKNLNAFKKNNVIWFNIKKDGRHAIIEEMTSQLGLKYRTLYENIPDFYSFSVSPSIILIDRNGIILLVYSGYSPTVINDIQSRISGIIK